MPVSTAVESRIADAAVSAHLATSVDDRPHVAPVWYGYRDGVLYFITGGKKLANVRRNPRVSLSLESARDGDVDWNVTLFGRATVRDEPERIEWASNWIYDKYNGDATDDEDDATDDEGNATDDEDDAIVDEALPADEPDESSQTDGGESTAGERDRALVEVTIGSGSMNVYE